MGVRLSDDDTIHPVDLIAMFIGCLMLCIVMTVGLWIKDHNAKIERIAEHRSQVAEKQGDQIVERCG